MDQSQGPGSEGTRWRRLRRWQGIGQEGGHRPPSLCWTPARAGHMLWRHSQPCQGWEHAGRGSNAPGEQEPL